MKKAVIFLLAMCAGSYAFGQKPGAANTAKPALTEFSKDNTFVPGDSVLFIDYFDQEKPGNSPIKWRTSFATPIVEISGNQYFKLLNNGEYGPKLIRTFPENYTIDFTISADGTPNDHGYVGNLFFTLGEATDGSFTNTVEHAQILTEVFVEKELSSLFHSNGNATSAGFSQTAAFRDKRGQPLHVALAINGKRLRLWVENEKLIDDTTLVYSDKFDTFRIGMAAWNQKDARVLLSGLRYAAVPADVAGRLKKEGKYSTAAIGFVPGTAKFAPGAEGAIARLAQQIKASPGARFKIIAHADADLKDAPTITKQRAEAIKKQLSEVHKIEAARLEAEGKGTAVAYAKGRTLEAKTNNNRIEIVKL